MVGSRLCGMKRWVLASRSGSPFGSRWSRFKMCTLRLLSRSASLGKWIPRCVGGLAPSFIIVQLAKD
eukprot:12937563-Prorocentrum_lima.AAC.1